MRLYQVFKKTTIAFMKISNYYTKSSTLEFHFIVGFAEVGSYVEILLEKLDFYLAP